MNTRLIILTAIVFFSVPLFARDNTDLIVMKNGDRMTCEIKGLNAGVLSVKLSYVQGAIGVDWSKVAHVESNQLFLVHTEEGTVYTGKLSTSGTPGVRAVRIEVASAPEKEVEISQPQIVKVGQAGEGFWQRFNGVINTGILYSKGNESTQYSVASQVGYQRERWSSQVSFNSSLASNSGASLSTRNQADLSTTRLLPWNNWSYSARTSFLQSSVQGIDLQTTLGGGVGRFLRNSSRESVYILGGLAWQNVEYKNYAVRQSAQNTATTFVEADLKVFRFKKTDLDASVVILPEISEPGRVRVNTNASYYVKLLGDLSWNFSFYGNWDNQPPPTLAGSDYGTSSGLSWIFGSK